MFSRSELVTAVIVCVVAVLVTPMEANTSIIPVGFLAGLAAIGSPTYSDAVIRGSRAGALGGILYITVMGLIVAGRLASVIGYLFAIDVFLFTSFTMMIMIVPLYGIQGLLVGPLVHWIGGKTSRVLNESTIAGRE